MHVVEVSRGPESQVPPDLGSFCRSQWPRLVGSLRLTTGDAHLAEELAQETVARICRDWPRVARMEAPGAWAHRVAMNLARSHFRRRRLILRSEARLRLGADAGDTAVAATASVALQGAIATLPERQRIALVLRYFADLSVRDAATAMGCPEGTVKTLTRKAILALRAKGLVDEDATSKEPSRDVC